MYCDYFISVQINKNYYLYLLESQHFTLLKFENELIKC